MNRMYLWHQLVLVHLGVVALGLSGRHLRGDENPGRPWIRSSWPMPGGSPRSARKSSKAFPPGDRSRQWTTERDNLLAAVRELPGLMRREGSAVREGFAWYTAGPVTEDTFDIQQSRGFLAPTGREFRRAQPSWNCGRSISTKSPKACRPRTSHRFSASRMTASSRTPPRRTIRRPSCTPWRATARRSSGSAAMTA